jgi:two-component system response regulator
VTRTILVVDDDPADRELILRALRALEAPAEIITACDGVEALDVLFCRGAHARRIEDALPALVLLDLKLPRADGVEVLRQMRQAERTRVVPAVLLTSSNIPGDVRRAFEAGANSYIQKPVDFDRFREVLKGIGEYWLTMNVAPPPVSES